MSNYLEPEYIIIEKSLEPFIAEHNLDEITVKSLVRGSVEIVEPDLPSVSYVILNEKDITSARSIKVKNIKINLKFALNSIFSLKSICEAEDEWLVLVVLKTIVSLFENMKIVLEKKEAIVLFCIYRLRSATAQEVQNYYKPNNFSKSACSEKLDEEDIKKAIGTLQKIGAVDEKDGKYYIEETIYVRH